MKRIRRVIMVQCPECAGLGRKAGTGYKCRTCNGAGEVERVVVEIVHDDNEVNPL